MIPPSDMLLFAAVVREGSFTRAATALGITKQSASSRVQALEERLGVRLLERTTRRLRPTDAGALYFERCSAIASAIDDANREVRQRQAEPTGLLRVSAPVLYGRRFLAPVVARYLAEYPKARIELDLADRRVNLIEEGLDLAIRVGPQGDSSLQARRLGDGHIYLVASPEFLSRHGRPTLETLVASRCIGTRPSETWELGGRANRFEPVLLVNDFEIACDAAIAGVGIARVPSLVCRDAVLSGRLTVLSWLGPPSVTPVFAVFPSRQYLPARVRVFLDALVALIEPMAPIPVDGLPRLEAP